MKRLVLLFAGACALGALSSCGDDPETIVELRVVETIPVDFEQMAGGITEAASVSLADLRDEPAYADAREALRCGGLRIDDSFIEVEALTVGTGATALTYAVAVAPRGSPTPTPLATYSGSIVAGQRVNLGDPAFTVRPEGLAQLAQIVLGGVPALDVQISGTVPGDVDDLRVALSLAIDFSSDAGACPSTTTGR